MHEQGNNVNTSIASANMTSDVFQAALGSLPGAFVIVDATDFSIRFGNGHFGERFGLNVGDNLMDIILHDEQDLFRLHAARSHTKGQEAKYVLYKLKNKNGVYMPYYAYLAPVPDADGTAKWYNVQFLPELSKWSLPFTSFESREVYLEQFSEVRFGTFEWYLHEDRLVWSDRMYDIYEVDPAVKNPDRAFFATYTHPDDRAKADAAIKHTIAEGEPLLQELRIITPKQTMKIVAAAAVVVRDEHGEAVKLAGSVKDITAQRMLEEELKKKIEELNRSNHELEEFAYVASHDLQEPLRKISTFCGRIAEKYADKLDAEGGMYVERVLASAENMRMLIHNLLEFSRVARDKEPFSEVNLSFVMHQVKTDLELLIEDTGATINYSKLPVISGSLTQLRQLFHNLLANAIKFRQKDVPPVIEISTTELTETEKIDYSLKQGITYHKICVKDNGIGFDNQYAGRIFQIFQRLHGKSEYPGSGIGLAICKKIAEHHKGIIYAEGSAGNGANFVIILPEQQS